MFDVRLCQQNTETYWRDLFDMKSIARLFCSRWTVLPLRRAVLKFENGVTGGVEWEGWFCLLFIPIIFLYLERRLSSTLFRQRENHTTGIDDTLHTGFFRKLWQFVPRKWPCPDPTYRLSRDLTSSSFVIGNIDEAPTPDKGGMPQFYM